MQKKSPSAGVPSPSSRAGDGGSGGGLTRLEITPPHASVETASVESLPRWVSFIRVRTLEACFWLGSCLFGRDPSWRVSFAPFVLVLPVAQMLEI